MHVIAVGGSDAGISAALRAREVDPGAEVTVVVADAYPNFSICGIPYYISGEVPQWRNLAHRTIGELQAAGMALRLETTARRIDVAGRKLLITGPGGEELMSYDQLVIGTGAVPARPPIAGLDALGPADGVHLLHSMDDTFAVMRTLEETSTESVVIVAWEADDHKAYYPGSHRIAMRFTGDRATGRLLGVQLFGHKHAEIAKRIDIAAAAIYSGLTVDEVSDLDLSYTPPLGSPWDAVQAGAQAWTRHAGHVMT